MPIRFRIGIEINEDSVMFEKIIEKINSAQRIGLFAHVNPDGDALGSMYSLKNVLASMGKNGEVFLCGKAESSVFNLIYDGETPKCEPEDCDLLIALDSSDIDRLGEWKETFSAHSNTAAIDHHITHIKYANETVVEDISSNCELLCGMYKEMSANISEKTATDLYIGIATDTGSFKYSSVTGDTHRAAAWLIEKGARFDYVSKKIFDTKSKEYFEILRLAISKIKYYAGGRIAYLCLEGEDFARCGIEEADANAVVSLPGSVEGVEASIYVRRRGEDEYKVSLRSSGYVDVARIALGFGGGGHVKAAGFSLTGSEFDSGVKDLISRISEQLEQK